MFNGMTQTAGDLSLIFTSWISWNQLMGCSSVTDSYSAWVHLCNKCWTSYPAAKKRLFRGGQDVLWQRGIRASIQKGWKEESHKREIPRSSDRITKKSLYPRVLVIFNRSFTPNLIIIANIFNWTSYWHWICLHNTIAILIIFKGLDGFYCKKHKQKLTLRWWGIRYALFSVASRGLRVKLEVMF